jgi:hypothetical protein
MKTQTAPVLSISEMRSPMIVQSIYPILLYSVDIHEKQLHNPPRPNIEPGYRLMIEQTL